MSATQTGVNLNQDAGPGALVADLVTRILAIIAVGLRFIARRRGGSKYWWDDWLILVAAVSLRLPYDYQLGPIKLLTKVWNLTDPLGSVDCGRDSRHEYRPWETYRIHSQDRSAIFTVIWQSMSAHGLEQFQFWMAGLLIKFRAMVAPLRRSALLFSHPRTGQTKHSVLIRPFIRCSQILCHCLLCSDGLRYRMGAHHRVTVHVSMQSHLGRLEPDAFGGNLFPLPSIVHWYKYNKCHYGLHDSHYTIAIHLVSQTSKTKEDFGHRGFGLRCMVSYIALPKLSTIGASRLMFFV